MLWKATNWRKRAHSLAAGITTFRRFSQEALSRHGKRDMTDVLVLQEPRSPTEKVAREGEGDCVGFQYEWPYHRQISPRAKAKACNIGVSFKSGDGARCWYDDQF